MGTPRQDRYSPQRVAFMVMCFLAGWMTLLTAVLVLRWNAMNESEQMLWIITPEQIMLNVFATIVFWGLVVVTKQNTTVAGWAGIVLYVLFALATVWAVGNKAEQINALKHATPGSPNYMSPLDMLTDPMAAVIHLVRIGLLLLVVRAKYKADEQWDVVDETEEAIKAVPDMIAEFNKSQAQEQQRDRSDKAVQTAQGYYTGAASIANNDGPRGRETHYTGAASVADDSSEWQILDGSGRDADEPQVDYTPTVRQIQRQPLHTGNAAQ